MLKRTTAQVKIANMRKRIRVAQGGTSSSKTFTIIPLLIQYAIGNSGKEISIVSESIPHLRRGAIRDFVKIMVWTGNMSEKRWNKSTLTYTFSNGSFIEFFSADQPDKMRGARRDVLFINECNNVHFEAYQQLSIRTREFIYLDYNPTAEFWVHHELIGQPDTDYVILTYKDNEALEQSIVREIEKAREKAKTSEYWANWWKVYGLGETGSLQGVVFSNWKTIDLIPDDANYVGTGLDFGFTNDPTAAIDVYKLDGKYLLDEVIYERELTNQDIAERLKQSDFKRRVIADSAEPKSIKEIANKGVMITGAKKGKDSILYGIQLMQQHEFLVTKRSTNLIKEFRFYCWDKDKQGNTLNRPIDDYNHGMDGVRYLITSQSKNKISIGGV